MTINNEKIVKRWNSVMNDIGCEHLTIGTRLSELEDHMRYYDIEDGISISWMIHEAGYWLKCYNEIGNVRCDDRFIDEDNYKIWLSESGKLKRLIERLKKMQDEYVVSW
jgi:hypothetical protein